MDKLRQQHTVQVTMTQSCLAPASTGIPSGQFLFHEKPPSRTDNTQLHLITSPPWSPMEGLPHIHAVTEAVRAESHDPILVGQAQSMQ